MAIEFDDYGKPTYPRLVMGRSLDPLAGALPSWLTMPTTGTDAGATATWLTPSNAANTNRPGIRLATSTANNTASTLVGEPINFDMAGLEFVRLHVLGNLNQTGNTRDISLGFLSTMDAPQSGVELFQAATTGTYCTFRAYAGGVRTTKQLDLAIFGPSNSLVDLSLWVSPSDKRVYLGNARDMIDLEWTAGASMALGVLSPFVRVLSKSAASKITMINQLDYDIAYQ